MQWYEGTPEQVYQRLRAAVEQELRTIVDRLRYETTLRQAIAYVVQHPGKRMRPLLCLLASALEGASPWEAVPAAAAVEILHTFTLVHDDIMDRSPLRRGQPTVHVRWSDAVAILTGDVLIGLAYQLLERYSHKPFFAQLVQMLSTGLIEVSEGQALDLELASCERPTLEDYWHMIDGKTAALLRTTLDIGALIGEVSAQTRAILRELATPLGRAFQLQDDLLDLIGTPELTGKRNGQDLREGKLTYAVLRALECAPLEAVLQRYRQQRRASEEDIPELLQLFQRLGILHEMQQQVEHYYARVTTLLGQLPEYPARELLRHLVDTLRERRS